mmetsp:Transcript_19961/g.70615  ORF Transcript_19961/g.70615 Transcript_19961/m.70615 type:complete len:399 (-) Transcript_19961:854-2050(-)
MPAASDAVRRAGMSRGTAARAAATNADLATSRARMRASGFTCSILFSSAVAGSLTRAHSSPTRGTPPAHSDFTISSRLPVTIGGGRPSSSAYNTTPRPHTSAASAKKPARATSGATAPARTAAREPSRTPRKAASPSSGEHALAAPTAKSPRRCLKNRRIAARGTRRSWTLVRSRAAAAPPPTPAPPPSRSPPPSRLPPPSSDASRWSIAHARWSPNDSLGTASAVSSHASLTSPPRRSPRCCDDTRSVAAHTLRCTSRFECSFASVSAKSPMTSATSVSVYGTPASLVPLDALPLPDPDLTRGRKRIATPRGAGATASVGARLSDGIAAARAAPAIAGDRGGVPMVNAPSPVATGLSLMKKPFVPTGGEGEGEGDGGGGGPAADDVVVPTGGIAAAK